jgi:hypothetical protein
MGDGDGLEPSDAVWSNIASKLAAEAKEPSDGGNG